MGRLPFVGGSRLWGAIWSGSGREIAPGEVYGQAVGRDGLAFVFFVKKQSKCVRLVCVCVFNVSFL